MSDCISLCLIVKDGEGALPTGLRSVADLVAEMIVVDTGSSDRTKEIAAALGARVFDFAWCDSFAAARNESIRQAAGDWIFWLDADEYLDEDNRGKLKALFGQLRNEPAAYILRQRSAPVHPGDSPTLVDQYRLFRNHPLCEQPHKGCYVAAAVLWRTGCFLRRMCWIGLAGYHII